MHIFFVFNAKCENIVIPTISTGRDLKRHIFIKFDIPEHNQIILHHNGQLFDIDAKILFSDDENTPLFLYSLSHQESNPDQRLETLLEENALSEQFIKFANILEKEAFLMCQSWDVLIKSYRKGKFEKAKLFQSCSFLNDKLNVHLKYFKNSKFENNLQLVTEMPILPALLKSRMIEQTFLPGENPTLFDLIKTEEFSNVDSINDYVNLLISECGHFQFENLGKIDQLHEEETKLNKETPFSGIEGNSEALGSVKSQLKQITSEMPKEMHFNDIPTDIQFSLVKKYKQTLESVEFIRRGVQECCGRFFDVMTRMSVSNDKLNMANVQLFELNRRFEPLLQIIEVPYMYVTAVKETIRRVHFKTAINSWVSDILEEGSRVSVEETERRRHITELFKDHFLSGLFAYLLETRVPKINKSLPSFGDINLPEIDIDDFFELEKKYNRRVFGDEFPQNTEDPSIEYSQQIQRMDAADSNNICSEHTSDAFSLANNQTSTEGSSKDLSKCNSPSSIQNVTCSTFSESCSLQQPITEGSDHFDNMTESCKQYVSYSTISVGDDILVMHGKQRFRILAIGSSSYILHKSSIFRIKEMAKIEFPNVKSYSVVCQVIDRKLVYRKSSNDTYKNGDVLIYVKPISIHRI